jgi:hypothetical protein
VYFVIPNAESVERVSNFFHGMSPALGEKTALLDHKDCKGFKVRADKTETHLWFQHKVKLVRLDLLAPLD